MGCKNIASPITEDDKSRVSNSQFHSNAFHIELELSREGTGTIHRDL